jgi:hypothetical protein
MRPSEIQQAALVLATSEGYVRPASATHARRCGTTCGRLSKTVAVCVRQGWLRPISDGRYVVTEAGQAFVPSSPVAHPFSEPNRDEAVF